MIKGLKITKTAIIAFFVAFVLSFLLAGLANAQEEDQEAAKKYNINFPIAELGGCEDISACKAYCSNEAKREQCTSFAKKKGFYKERQKDEGLIKQAENELGCDSETSCRSICEKEENIDKCQSFAQKYGLGDGPKGNPKDRGLLEKAKTILGCDSETSCRSVCENPANQEKCSNFASQTGLGGGVRKVGPGGCNSEESCKSFCENNIEECKKFGGPPEGAGGGRQGPGGCNSEESCNAYCQSNPEECAKLGPGDGKFGREGDKGRKGPGGCDSEESCRRYCESNPAECGSGERGRGEPGREGGPSEEEKEKGRPSEDFRGFNDRRFEDRKSQGEEYQRPEDNQRLYEERRGEDSSRSEETREEFKPSSEQPQRQEEVKGVSTQRGLFQQFIDWLF